MSTNNQSLALPYGALIPHGDPTWYQGWHSPYYNTSHQQLRDYVRKWVDKNITNNVHDWDENKAVPMSLLKAFAEDGLLALSTGPILTKNLITYPLPCGLTVDTFDVFHELVFLDELSRCGSGGVLWALLEGSSIGLPPIILFGSEAMKKRIAIDVLAGRKNICLCITEPSAGSDVAAIKTTAIKKDNHYLVNGIKKWITNGVFSDYFTVAVRTGGEGANGISLLLLERSMAGISTTQMKCSGVWSSGTTLVTFDNVKVPFDNLIGLENQGFKLIMKNFNHERFGLTVQSLRFARVCLEDAMVHAQRRSTFGKKLIDHPVIRNKLAHMTRHVEATQAWLESVAFMMQNDKDEKIGGMIALLKVQATTTFELCAREASQIFGGLAYTRGGLGERVERLYREVRPYAIGGGSEEIMLDMGVCFKFNIYFYFYYRYFRH